MLQSYYYTTGFASVPGLSKEDLKKWDGASLDPFETEEKIEQLVAPVSFAAKEIDEYIQNRIDELETNRPGDPEIAAWKQRKVERAISGMDEKVDNKFFAEFISFLLGRVDPNCCEYKIIGETGMNPEFWSDPIWKSPNLSVAQIKERVGWRIEKQPPVARQDKYGDEIRRYIQTYLDRHHRMIGKTIQLKMIGPKSLAEHWLFFKYIVKGNIKEFGTRPIPELFYDTFDWTDPTSKYGMFSDNTETGFSGYGKWLNDCTPTLDQRKDHLCNPVAHTNAANAITAANTGIIQSIGSQFIPQPQPVPPAPAPAPNPSVTATTTAAPPATTTTTTTTPAPVTTTPTSTPVVTATQPVSHSTRQAIAAANARKVSRVLAPHARTSPVVTRRTVRTPTPAPPAPVQPTTVSTPTPVPPVATPAPTVTVTPPAPSPVPPTPTAATPVTVAPTPAPAQPATTPPVTVAPTPAQTSASLVATATSPATTTTLAGNPQLQNTLTTAATSVAQTPLPAYNLFTPRTTRSQTRALQALGIDPSQISNPTTMRINQIQYDDVRLNKLFDSVNLMKNNAMQDKTYMNQVLMDLLKSNQQTSADVQQLTKLQSTPQQIPVTPTPAPVNQVITSPDLTQAAAQLSSAVQNINVKSTVDTGPIAQAVSSELGNFFQGLQLKATVDAGSMPTPTIQIPYDPTQVAQILDNVQKNTTADLTSLFKRTAETENAIKSIDSILKTLPTKKDLMAQEQSFLNTFNTIGNMFDKQTQTIDLLQTKVSNLQNQTTTPSVTPQQLNTVASAAANSTATSLFGALTSALGSVSSQTQANSQQIQQLGQQTPQQSVQHHVYQPDPNIQQKLDQLQVSVNTLETTNENNLKLIDSLNKERQTLHNTVASLEQAYQDYKSLNTIKLTTEAEKQFRDRILQLEADLKIHTSKVNYKAEIEKHVVDVMKAQFPVSQRNDEFKALLDKLPDMVASIKDMTTKLQNLNFPTKVGLTMTPDIEKQLKNIIITSYLDKITDSSSKLVDDAAVKTADLIETVKKACENSINLMNSSVAKLDNVTDKMAKSEDELSVHQKDLMSGLEQFAKDLSEKTHKTLRHNARDLKTQVKDTFVDTETLVKTFTNSLNQYNRDITSTLKSNQSVSSATDKALLDLKSFISTIDQFQQLSSNNVTTTKALNDTAKALLQNLRDQGLVSPKEFQVTVNTPVDGLKLISDKIIEDNKENRKLFTELSKSIAENQTATDEKFVEMTEKLSETVTKVVDMAQTLDQKMDIVNQFMKTAQNLPAITSEQTEEILEEIIDEMENTDELLSSENPGVSLSKLSQLTAETDVKTTEVLAKISDNAANPKELQKLAPQLNTQKNMTTFLDTLAQKSDFLSPSDKEKLKKEAEEKLKELQEVGRKMNEAKAANALKPDPNQLFKGITLPADKTFETSFIPKGLDPAAVFKEPSPSIMNTFKEVKRMKKPVEFVLPEKEFENSKYKYHPPKKQETVNVFADPIVEEQPVQFNREEYLRKFQEEEQKRQKQMESEMDFDLDEDITRVDTVKPTEQREEYYEDYFPEAEGDYTDYAEEYMAETLATKRLVREYDEDADELPTHEDFASFLQEMDPNNDPGFTPQEIEEYRREFIEETDDLEEAEEEDYDPEDEMHSNDVIGNELIKSGSQDPAAFNDIIKVAYDTLKDEKGEEAANVYFESALNVDKIANLSKSNHMQLTAFINERSNDILTKFTEKLTTVDYQLSDFDKGVVREFVAKKLEENSNRLMQVFNEVYKTTDSLKPMQAPLKIINRGFELTHHESQFLSLVMPTPSSDGIVTRDQTYQSPIAIHFGNIANGDEFLRALATMPVADALKKAKNIDAGQALQIELHETMQRQLAEVYREFLGKNKDFIDTVKAQDQYENTMVREWLNQARNQGYDNEMTRAYILKKLAQFKKCGLHETARKKLAKKVTIATGGAIHTITNNEAAEPEVGAILQNSMLEQDSLKVAVNSGRSTGSGTIVSGHIVDPHIGGGVKNSGEGVIKSSSVVKGDPAAMEARIQTEKERQTEKNRALKHAERNQKAKRLREYFRQSERDKEASINRMRQKEDEELDRDVFRRDLYGKPNKLAAEMYRASKEDDLVWKDYRSFKKDQWDHILQKLETFRYTPDRMWVPGRFDLTDSVERFDLFRVYTNTTEFQSSTAENNLYKKYIKESVTKGEESIRVVNGNYVTGHVGNAPFNTDDLKTFGDMVRFHRDNEHLSYEEAVQTNRLSTADKNRFQVMIASMSPVNLRGLARLGMSKKDFMDAQQHSWYSSKGADYMELLWRSGRQRAFVHPVRRGQNYVEFMAPSLMELTSKTKKEDYRKIMWAYREKYYPDMTPEGLSDHYANDILTKKGGRLYAPVDYGIGFGTWNKTFGTDPNNWPETLKGALLFIKQNPLQQFKKGESKELILPKKSKSDPWKTLVPGTNETWQQRRVRIRSMTTPDLTRTTGEMDYGMFRDRKYGRKLEDWRSKRRQTQAAKVKEATRILNERKFNAQEKGREGLAKRAEEERPFAKLFRRIQEHAAQKRMKQQQQQ